QADLSNLSLNDDDFEIISGADSSPHSIYPTLNNSLVLPPMLVSTTTLVGQESIKEPSIGPAKERPEYSIASSHSSDGIAALLRAQEETLALTERQLQEYSIMQESLKASSLLHSQMEELKRKNEQLEKELEGAHEIALNLTETMLCTQRESVKASTLLRSQMDELEAKNEKMEKELRKGDAEMKEITDKFLSASRQTAEVSQQMHSEIDQLTTQNKFLERELETSRAEIAQAHKDKHDFSKASSLLQSRMDELSTKNGQLERELEEARTRAAAMTLKQHQDFAMMQESLRSKIDELSMNNEKLERELEETRVLLGSLERDVRQEVNEELRKKDDTISSLSLQVIHLGEDIRASEEAKEQQLRRAPSLDEMEKMRSGNAILQKMIAELNKELAGNQRTVDNLLSKSDDSSLHKQKVRELEAELNAFKAESENNQAIISVLKEENDEGTRLLSDQRGKIEKMKRTLEKYGYFSDF
ncbi:hypothetical protein PENTCL1PPCAC_12060, partial [Pristionchus entomophagus]